MQFYFNFRKQKSALCSRKHKFTGKLCNRGFSFESDMSFKSLTY